MNESTIWKNRDLKTRKSRSEQFRWHDGSITDTVPPCVSRWRRWKSSSIPATSAPSAERTPSSARLLVSGSARVATRLPPVVPTLSRKWTYGIWDGDLSCCVAVGDTTWIQDLAWTGISRPATRRRMPNWNTGLVTDRWCFCRTPAAAATRSTIRRLREIAEV